MLETLDELIRDKAGLKLDFAILAKKNFFQPVFFVSEVPVKMSTPLIIKKSGRQLIFLYIKKT